MPGTPWDLSFTAAPGAPLTVDPRVEAIAREYDAATLIVALRNDTADPVTVDQITVSARLDLATASALAWTFGEQPGIRRLDDLDGGETLGSADALVIEAPVRATPVLLVALTAMDTYGITLELLSDADATTIESLNLTVDFEGVTVAPGAELLLPPVRFAQGTDATELLDEWGHAVEEAMGSSAPVLGASLWRAPSGADVAALAGGINALVEAGYDLSTIIIPLDVIPGAGLPPETAELVDVIHDSGLQACISIAPLLAPADSPLLATEPAAALRNASGAPVEVTTMAGPRLVLDATHPAVTRWLQEVTAEVLALDVAELEITGLDHAAVPPRNAAYGRPVTARGHVREALTAIHSVAMPNLDIIAGDGPAAAAIGLADLIVIDAAVPGVMAAAAFLNTCHATPALQLPLGAPPQIVRRAAATAAVSASGVILTGDPRATAPESVAVLRSVLPPGGSAGALDAGDPPELEAWRAPVDEGFANMALFNNSDEPEWLAVTEFVDPGEVAFDPWSGQILDRGDVLLQPGDAAVWQIGGQSATPQVIGDTGHVARERLELRAVSGRLQVENEDSLPRIIAVDIRGRRQVVDLEPGEKRWFD